MPTRGIKNCRFNRFFKDCSPLQLLCNLIGNRPQSATFHTANVTINFKKERKTLTSKKIILFSVILFSAFLTFGQTEQQDIIVLRKAIGKTPDSLITYAEQSTGWKRIEEYFDKRKFKGQSPDTKQNSITPLSVVFQKNKKDVILSLFATEVAHEIASLSCDTGYNYKKT